MAAYLLKVSPVVNWEHVLEEGKVPARMIYEAFETYGEKSRCMDKSIGVVARSR